MMIINRKKSIIEKKKRIKIKNNGKEQQQCQEHQENIECDEDHPPPLERASLSPGSTSSDSLKLRYSRPELNQGNPSQYSNNRSYTPSPSTPPATSAPVPVPASRSYSDNSFT